MNNNRKTYYAFSLIAFLVFAISPIAGAEEGSNSEEDRSLLNSDGSRFVPKDFYPKFSWETTPRYFMFGDKSRVLRPEQVRFIADQTDFLCIEKSHGMDELGAAELGAKHEAAAFKKIKPDMKVLFYFNAAYAWPYTSYNKDFTNMKPNMPELSQKKVEFALACYLIGAEPYSYFMYSWGWKLGTGALVDYPELRKPLGPPKGAYHRTTPDGWDFTREFEHASVWVNTETRQAKITWR